MSAEKAFIANLKSSKAFERWSAADMLGRMRSRAAVDTLLPAIFDEYFAVQIEAVKALGKIGDAKALAPLKDLINSLADQTEEDLLLRKRAKDAVMIIQEHNL